jgi:hypothetical protein
MPLQQHLLPHYQIRRSRRQSSSLPQFCSNLTGNTLLLIVGGFSSAEVLNNNLKLKNSKKEEVGGSTTKTPQLKNDVMRDEENTRKYTLIR